MFIFRLNSQQEISSPYQIVRISKRGNTRTKIPIHSRQDSWKTLLNNNHFIVPDELRKMKIDLSPWRAVNRNKPVKIGPVHCLQDSSRNARQNRQAQQQGYRKCKEHRQGQLCHHYLPHRKPGGVGSSKYITLWKYLTAAGLEILRTSSHSNEGKNSRLSLESYRRKEDIRTHKTRKQDG